MFLEAQSSATKRLIKIMNKSWANHIGTGRQQFFFCKLVRLFPFDMHTLSRPPRQALWEFEGIPQDHIFFLSRPYHSGCVADTVSQL